MTIERYLRGIAGFFILLTVALAHFHSRYWLLFTAFVALNLLQSAFTNWCLMMSILRWLGLGGEALSCAATDSPTSSSKSGSNAPENVSPRRR